ncbi:DODA-type extradiol aromatic ring-opening family dioxygenase [Jatrophihabitans sp. DSM 45814]
MSIVGSFAVSHAPGMVAWPDAVDPGVHERLIVEGYRRAGERLRALNPDVVVLVTGEHFANFFSVIPPFCIHIGERSEGPIEPWLGLTRRTIPTDGSLGDTILRAALAAGRDLAFSHELLLDHGSMVPLELMQVPADLPIVPLIVNTLVDPLPSLDSCRRLGVVLGETLRAVDQRVVLIGAGGLSHWPGMAEAGKMSPEWDRALLADLVDGRRDTLWNPPSVGWAEAGPGAEEIRAWAVVGAAAPDGPAEVLAYEAVDAWATGCAVVDLQRVPVPAVS